MKRTLALGLTVVILLAGDVFAVPQEKPGRLVGTVKDDFGRPIAGATVTLGGVQGQAITSRSGEFEFENVVPGSYAVSVQARAFLSESLPVTRIESAKTKKVKFTLRFDPSFPSQLKMEWYGKHFKVFDENPLCSENSNSLPSTETYRFLWLRTFHQPIHIAVTRSAEGEWRVTAKVLSGHGGYEPGDLLETKTRTMTSAEVDGFLATLNTSEFWGLPRESERMGNDGAQWIVEGIRDQRCHVVDRWSPESSPYRNVGLEFLKLSGLHISPIY